MNFSKERFANFAKYDLAINKVFYRNLALFTTIGAVGIAVLGFMGRYTMWKGVTSDGGIDADPYSYSGYNSLFGTAGYVVGFLGIMLYIFAGCSFHNLRNKQGRITELTLPATNLEKFVWHTGLMLGGGFILCILSLLLADGVNALLTLAVYGSEGGVASLTASVGDLFAMNIPAWIGDSNIIVNGEGLPMNERAALGYALLHSIGFCVVCAAIAETIIYLFGNAVKYKYNIILTYVAMQVLGFIFVILFFIGIAIFAGRVDAIYEVENGGEILAHDMMVGFYIIGSLALILAAFLGWKSYRLYTQAQITTPLNK